MTKLKTDAYYLKECGACKFREKFILRASNVNKDLTDDDIFIIAQNHVGDKEGGYCDKCKLYTEQTYIGYRFYQVDE